MHIYLFGFRSTHFFLISSLYVALLGLKHQLVGDKFNVATTSREVLSEILCIK